MLDAFTAALPPAVWQSHTLTSLMDSANVHGGGMCLTDLVTNLEVQKPRRRLGGIFRLNAA